MTITEKTTGKGEASISHNCKTYGKKSDIQAPRCKECKVKALKQFETCQSLIAASKKAESKKAENKPASLPGYWGYRKGSYTDLFCNAICEKPMTMNQAAAIIDMVTGQPIGPHPKCKKRLLSENLATFDGHFIFMRVYPKGHPSAGQLTNAAKIHREGKAKAESKKAA